MKKTALMFCLLILASAGLATAEEAPTPVDAAVEVTEAVEAQQTAETDAEPTKQCLVNNAEGNDFKVDTNFGPHCSDDWTCTYQEPGLGFGCTCTYSCDCATCNGQLVHINCVLVDDGGCLACPSYN